MADLDERQKTAAHIFPLSMKLPNVTSRKQLLSLIEDTGEMIQRELDLEDGLVEETGPGDLSQNMEEILQRAKENGLEPPEEYQM